MGSQPVARAPAAREANPDDRDGDPIRAGTVCKNQRAANLPIDISAIYENPVGRRGGQWF
ncbi:hypothetical protein Sinme_6314 [Sinorhizobium meliloti AK83]|nr:hypothetical protein Sinme_6314 [Sinorhizobium meliloti AK83]SEJ83339.1 hypothetical protein SAMN04244575_06473 [Sinorhizobium meliloti]